jgi:hypothetical protein
VGCTTVDWAAAQVELSASRRVAQRQRVRFVSAVDDGCRQVAEQSWRAADRRDRHAGRATRLRTEQSDDGSREDECVDGLERLDRQGLTGCPAAQDGERVVARRDEPLEQVVVNGLRG